MEGGRVFYDCPMTYLITLFLAKVGPRPYTLCSTTFFLAKVGPIPYALCPMTLLLPRMVPMSYAL
jgi:hypothetical protein